MNKKYKWLGKCYISRLVILPVLDARESSPNPWDCVSLFFLHTTNISNPRTIHESTAVRCVVLVYTHSLKLSTAPAFIRRVLNTYMYRRWVTWIGKHSVNTSRESYFILLNIIFKYHYTNKVERPLFWSKPPKLTRKVKDLQSFWQMFPHWIVFFFCTRVIAVRMLSSSAPSGGWNRTLAIWSTEADGCSLHSSKKLLRKLTMI